MRQSILTIVCTGCCLAVVTAGASAVTNIDPDTDYLGLDLTGEELTASDLELGTTRFRTSNVSGTFWTAAPSFTGMVTQAHRLTDFTGADWSGATFIAANDTNQAFKQANFTNANFSGTTFSTPSVEADYADMFADAIFDNTNFSGATISQSEFEVYSIFRGTIFNSACDFSGATIIGTHARFGGYPASFLGSTFEDATIGTKFQDSNLDGCSFQNATFVSGADLRFNHANDTNFQGADFSGISFADHLPSLTWDAGHAPTYDANTIFTTENGTFDPVAAGWALIAAPSVLLGDANNDGVVSADDFAAVQTNFGNTGAADGLLPGDANDDGVVSADDFAAIQTNFGNVLGAAAEAAPVPEPATMALLAIGGLAATFRGRGRRRA